MPQTHSRPTPAGRAVWRTERLWELAGIERIPAVRFPVDPPPDEVVPEGGG